MNFISIALRSLVALSFVALAACDWLGVQRVQLAVTGMGVPRLARWAARLLALLLGLALLASVVQPFLAFFAATLLAGVALIATAVFLRRGMQRPLVLAATLALGAIGSAALEPLGLRVLCLPHADTLPIERGVTGRVLHVYDEGQWLESVRVAPDGTLLLSSNTGENFQTGDKSRVVAQIIARTPEGGERVLFRLPPATTAGVLALSADGTVYFTSDGAARGVWRMGLQGHAELFAPMPAGSWPNGLELGPDGNLYVADASQGTIWRVDPQSGRLESALSDAALRRRAFVALAPAANGLHFVGRELYVTVSDTAQLIASRLDENGRLGPVRVVATGIPGDDFAADLHGDLFVTTHPYDTLVRVTPAGQRTVVANVALEVVGATDVAFGVRPGDERTLYVVTDGGAFRSGDLKARGTLLMLTLPR